MIRECQNWLTGRFNEFDYTNDAIFESFRDYPRKKQLYRKHKDIAKDYDRKLKFYKSCQRWYSTEMNRQKQKVEERFSKLLQYTFDTNQTKTKGLQTSYSKWTSIHPIPVGLHKFPNTTDECTKTKDNSQEEPSSIAEASEQVAKSPTHIDTSAIARSQSLRNISLEPAHTGTNVTERLHSLKSISLENIPKVEEDQNQADIILNVNKQIDIPQMEKAVSSLTLRDIKHAKPQKYLKVSRFIKLTSH